MYMLVEQLVGKYPADYSIENLLICTIDLFMHKQAQVTIRSTLAIYFLVYTQHNSF